MLKKYLQSMASPSGLGFVDWGVDSSGCDYEDEPDYGEIEQTGQHQDFEPGSGFTLEEIINYDNEYREQDYNNPCTMIQHYGQYVAGAYRCSVTSRSATQYELPLTSSRQRSSVEAHSPRLALESPRLYQLVIADVDWLDDTLADWKKLAVLDPKIPVLSEEIVFEDGLLDPGFVANVLENLLVSAGFVRLGDVEQIETELIQVREAGVTQDLEYPTVLAGEEIWEAKEILQNYDGDFGIEGSFSDDYWSGGIDCAQGFSHFLERQTPLYHGTKEDWQGDFRRKRVGSGKQAWKDYRGQARAGDYTRGKLSGLPLEAFFLSPHPAGSFFYMEHQDREYDSLLETDRLKTYYLDKGLEIWDYRRPEHLELLAECAIQNGYYPTRPISTDAYEAFISHHRDGVWTKLQTPLILDCIRYMGFDGFINNETYVLGGGEFFGPAIAVFHNQALLTETDLWDIYNRLCS